MLLASELKKALALGVATPQDCPESTPNPADEGCNSQLAQYSSTPVLQYSSTPSLHHSITPSLRVAGFEDDDEDEDEDENKAPRIAPAPWRFTAFLATLLAISRGWVPGIERGPSSVR